MKEVCRLDNYTRSHRELEQHFSRFRRQTLGYNGLFRTPYGIQRILYADWAASGRMYGPIERKLIEDFGPYAANTHSEATFTGAMVTNAYREAKRLIKHEIHAGPDDLLLFCGNGMTAAVNKLQRLLGLRMPTGWEPTVDLPEEERPVVFVTHMEHHSNQISWQETIADVIVLEPDEGGQVSAQRLEEAVQSYSHRKRKIGAFTSCSNVTGIMPELGKLARVMHRHGGIVFADWTASAPYSRLTMHPDDPEEALDAVYFSPHKFLGGPGSSGVLAVNSKLVVGPVPDLPGGGTVLWTDRWGGVTYLEDKEEREDGGTPGYLQAAKAALAFALKEQMGADEICERECQLTELLLNGMDAIPGIRILDHELRERLPVVSFTCETIHYPLIVRLLNDRFGIQSRGGCSCAGTYGHFLFGLSKDESERIRRQVEKGNLLEKPGWVRLSLHPIIQDAEVRTILHALRQVIRFAPLWRKDYRYDPQTNDYIHLRASHAQPMKNWFSL
ncbi:aminotransferase class V-fold PLP-dependent enzyme [Gorillibacterium timonense]|uniref:aminotransferase class V-fold PLP-dependent enzyme n=1 Tax=Gorillibacterium timonense TaxID=1689269 RepID=UPI00071DF703|nr:aminotransferase class V-fold PLP-dependent enzyme [Gorillibacterium timonense]